MTRSATITAQAPTTAGTLLAFDRLAASYDATFTDSLIGRAQRNAVWSVVRRAFRAGDRVLELNCGTGEDAIFLAGRGVSVVACDGSKRMIEVARSRKAKSAPNAAIEFRALRSEEINTIGCTHRFDGVLSNFSGLNCVADLSDIAAQLGALVRTRGLAVICMSTRICPWEIVWHGARGDFIKAFRRVPGKAVARLDGVLVPVWYPSLRQLRRAFSPWFRVRSVRAVGLFVPPSYAEQCARHHRRLLRAAESLDRTFATWPLLRGLGDHVLLEMERTPIESRAQA